MEEKKTSKQIGKSALIGLFASFIMYILMVVGINTGLAPFNILPSEALLVAVGMPSKLGALLTFFTMGTFWSVSLFLTIDRVSSISKSIGVGLFTGLLLWFSYMTISSLVIGWGAFGYGEQVDASPDSPFYLSSTFSYIAFTLFVHLMYGFIVGGLTSMLWMKKGYVRYISPVVEI